MRKNTMMSAVLFGLSVSSLLAGAHVRASDDTNDALVAPPSAEPAQDCTYGDICMLPDGRYCSVFPQRRCVGTPCECDGAAGTVQVNQAVEY